MCRVTHTGAPMVGMLLATNSFQVLKNKKRIDDYGLIMITYNLGGYKTSQRHHKSTSEQLVLLLEFRRCCLLCMNRKGEGEPGHCFSFGDRPL